MKHGRCVLSLIGLPDRLRDSLTKVHSFGSYGRVILDVQEPKYRPPRPVSDGLVGSTRPVRRQKRFLKESGATLHQILVAVYGSPWPTPIEPAVLHSDSSF
jgi:hypothetical protein